MSRRPTPANALAVDAVAQRWIYIQATQNIQEALLAQLNPVPEFRAATGFAIELCGPNERAERCKRLIQELHSVANEGHAKLIPQF